jgi:hypothetical protein
LGRAHLAGLSPRVPTEAQGKQQAIGSLFAERRRYTEARGLMGARELVDDGSSAVLERPGLDALRDSAAAGGVETY